MVKQVNDFSLSINRSNGEKVFSNRIYGETGLLKAVNDSSLSINRSNGETGLTQAQVFSKLSVNDQRFFPFN